jgi:hypothetical protein
MFELSLGKQTAIICVLLATLGFSLQLVELGQHRLLVYICV